MNRDHQFIINCIKKSSWSFQFSYEQLSYLTLDSLIKSHRSTNTSDDADIDRIPVNKNILRDLSPVLQTKYDQIQVNYPKNLIQQLIRCNHIQSQIDQKISEMSQSDATDLLNMFSENDEIKYFDMTLHNVLPTLVPPLLTGSANETSEIYKYINNIDVFMKHNYFECNQDVLLVVVDAIQAHVAQRLKTTSTSQLEQIREMCKQILDTIKGMWKSSVDRHNSPILMSDPLHQWLLSKQEMLINCQEKLKHTHSLSKKDPYVRFLEIMAVNCWKDIATFVVSIDDEGINSVRLYKANLLRFVAEHKLYNYYTQPESNCVILIKYNPLISGNKYTQCGYCDTDLWTMIEKLKPINKRLEALGNQISWENQQLSNNNEYSAHQSAEYITYQGVLLQERYTVFQHLIAGLYQQTGALNLNGDGDPNNDLDALIQNISILSGSTSRSATHYGLIEEESKQDGPQFIDDIGAFQIQNRDAIRDCLVSISRQIILNQINSSDVVQLFEVLTQNAFVGCSNNVSQDIQSEFVGTMITLMGKYPEKFIYFDAENADSATNDDLKHNQYYLLIACVANYFEIPLCYCPQLYFRQYQKSVEFPAYSYHIYKTSTDCTKLVVNMILSVLKNFKHQQYDDHWVPFYTILSRIGIESKKTIDKRILKASYNTLCMLVFSESTIWWNAFNSLKELGLQIPGDYAVNREWQIKNPQKSVESLEFLILPKLKYQINESKPFNGWNFLLDLQQADMSYLAQEQYENNDQAETELIEQTTKQLQEYWKQLKYKKKLSLDNFIRTIHYFLVLQNVISIRELCLQLIRSILYLVMRTDVTFSAATMPIAKAYVNNLVLIRFGVCNWVSQRKYNYERIEDAIEYADSEDKYEQIIINHYKQGIPYYNFELNENRTAFDRIVAATVGSVVSSRRWLKMLTIIYNNNGKPEIFGGAVNQLSQLQNILQSLNKLLQKIQQSSKNLSHSDLDANFASLYNVYRQSFYWYESHRNEIPSTQAYNYVGILGNAAVFLLLQQYTKSINYDLQQFISNDQWHRHMNANLVTMQLSDTKQQQILEKGIKIFVKYYYTDQHIDSFDLEKIQDQLELLESELNLYQHNKQFLEYIILCYYLKNELIFIARQQKN